MAKDREKRPPEKKKSRGNGDVNDSPALPLEAQGRIGKQLRRVYSDILSEPMPDKFSKLLEDLAKSEKPE